MVHDPIMPSKPVQISIDTDLLRRIDEDPEAHEQGRSAFIRRAVEIYFDARERSLTVLVWRIMPCTTM
jgi:metal-responsive CopG/Arc/MetJ family transcriptional regulator